MLVLGHTAIMFCRSKFQRSLVFVFIIHFHI